MGLKEKMKFFMARTTFLISNYLTASWACLCDVLNTFESSHPSCCLYSKLHNQHPKNVDPNNVFSNLEILVANDENYAPSISLPKHLYSRMEDIQHGYEHDLCSQLLLISSHSPNYKSELANRDNASEHRLAIHGNDISLSKQYGHLNGLYYVNYFYIPTSCKDTKKL